MLKREKKMKRNVICIPFAYKEDANSGANISKNINKRTEIYLKNAAVALCSARIHNNDSDIVFATNMKTIPHFLIELFGKYRIRVEYIPYNEFVFPNNYPWSLAFYKLCVLSYFCKQEFDNFCYMDTDVFVQGSFNNIWKECNSHLLLYDINHGLQVKGYIEFCNEINSFEKSDSLLITHYGGEFYAGNHKDTVTFLKTANRIYKKMIDNKYISQKGDEFILSLAAYKSSLNIKNAAAYIHRFWTGPSFRLVSTCYKNNEVSVLHLPAEKEHGILKIFIILTNGGLEKIDKKKIWKICRLSDSSMHMKFLEFFAKLRIKMRKK